MEKPALIVIDMQPAFHAANNPKTIAACKKLLLEAISNKQMIVFLEYKWNGKTLPELTSLVKDYPFKFFIQKKTDNGAEEIQQAFIKYKINPKNLIVCGVNTDCCVLDTVRFLNDSKKYNISLIQEACNTVWQTGPEAIKIMKLWGVEII